MHIKEKTVRAKRKSNQAAKTEWLKVMLTREPAEIALEAAYYAVRELKQLSIPIEQRKEHLEDAPKSEPTIEGRRLALQIMSEIEAHEATNKADLSKQQAESYIELMLTAVRKLSTDVHPIKAGLGERLLAKLRAQG